ncbi:uncharacterized protein LOC142408684 [Mycteria americana]|uniref:uncharacterized protein LOC142408684 n=1 Tax=Mycteria americana TaxID=33587 RepID=UPI003F586D1C
MKKTLSEQQLLQRQCNKLATTWHHLVSETRMTDAIRQDLSEPLKGPSEETHKTNRQSWQSTPINGLRPKGKKLEEVSGGRAWHRVTLSGPRRSLRRGTAASAYSWRSGAPGKGRRILPGESGEPGRFGSAVCTAWLRRLARLTGRRGDAAASGPCGLRGFIAKRRSAVTQNTLSAALLPARIGTKACLERKRNGNWMLGVSSCRALELFGELLSSEGTCNCTPSTWTCAGSRILGPPRARCYGRLELLLWQDQKKVSSFGK